MRLRAQWPHIWLRAADWRHLIALGDTYSGGTCVAKIVATTDCECICLADGTALAIKPQITRSGQNIEAYAPAEHEP